MFAESEPQAVSESQAEPAVAPEPEPVTPSASLPLEVPSDEPAEQVAVSVEQELGDTDLVAELLHSRPGLCDKAMRIVRDQSGIDIHYADQYQQVPQADVRVAVRWQKQSFGFLHTAHAQESDLQPWAEWLGHWLALDQQQQSLWKMALQDDLTGAWNRRYFFRFLKNMIGRAERERFQVTVMVFDIDNFKTYNDQFGHPAGDEILSETVQMMRAATRDQDVVARIGGDEFGVIFWDAGESRTPNSQHPRDVQKATRRFREAIARHRFPKLADQAPGKLTISGGLATYPWDGRTADELFALADDMALKSKQQGKNALTFGPGAQRAQHGE